MKISDWFCFRRHCGLFAGALLVLPLASGCSVKKFAINKLGDALAGGGGSGGTFASDDDPELIKAALPFSLKLIESLLAESPKHRGLLLAACSGFTQYSYAFVAQEADEKQDSELAVSEALRARARRLYLRARGYGWQGLELNHPGFTNELRRAPKQAVSVATKKDVPLLFWTAAAWGSAISVSKDDPLLISDQLIVEALLDRVLALDPDYDHGAIHTVMIGYEMIRQGVQGDPEIRAMKHFERAMELAKGHSAGPLVSLAEAVAVQKQDRAQFTALLNRALAIDADAAPGQRLSNLLSQRRARWLLGRMDELFLNPVPTVPQP